MSELDGGNMLRIENLVNYAADKDGLGGGGGGESPRAKETKKWAGAVKNWNYYGKLPGMEVRDGMRSEDRPTVLFWDVKPMKLQGARNESEFRTVGGEILDKEPGAVVVSCETGVTADGVEGDLVRVYFDARTRDADHRSDRTEAMVELVVDRGRGGELLGALESGIVRFDDLVDEVLPGVGVWNRAGESAPGVGTQRFGDERKVVVVENRTTLEQVRKTEGYRIVELPAESTEPATAVVNNPVNDEFDRGDAIPGLGLRESLRLRAGKRPVGEGDRSNGAPAIRNEGPENNDSASGSTIEGEMVGEIFYEEMYSDLAAFLLRVRDRSGVIKNNVDEIRRRRESLIAHHVEMERLDGVDRNDQAAKERRLLFRNMVVGLQKIRNVGRDEFLAGTDERWDEGVRLMNAMNIDTVQLLNWCDENRFAPANPDGAPRPGGRPEDGDEGQERAEAIDYEEMVVQLDRAAVDVGAIRDRDERSEALTQLREAVQVLTEDFDLKVNELIARGDTGEAARALLRLAMRRLRNEAANVAVRAADMEASRRFLNRLGINVDGLLEHFRGVPQPAAEATAGDSDGWWQPNPAAPETGSVTSGITSRVPIEYFRDLQIAETIHGGGALGTRLQRLLDHYARADSGVPIEELKRLKILVEESAGRSEAYDAFRTDADYVRLVMDETYERELQGSDSQSKDWTTMGVDFGGVEVPVFRYMKDREALRDKLKEMVAARKGINYMYGRWRDNCTNVDQLSRAFGFKVEDVEATDKTGALDLRWLETLSTAEGDLGIRIGEGFKRYVEVGEKVLVERARILADLEMYDAQRCMPILVRISDLEATRKPWSGLKIFGRQSRADREIQDLRDQLEVAQAGKKIYTDRLKSIADSDLNIFSSYTSEAATDAVRKRMATGIGADAEELAFRLMYLTGLAGYYNFDQSPANPYRDDLASLYRPNDAWQGFREANSTEPGPLQIVGYKGVINTQYFRQYSFVQPYPMYIGDVLLRDGTVMDCFEALKAGKFSQIMWNEIKTGYGLFEYKVNIARKLKLALVERSTDERIKEDNMLAFKDLVTRVIEHKREIVATEMVDETTSDLRPYRRRKYKRASGDADAWTQALLFNFYRSVLAQHSPSDITVGKKDMWEWRKVNRLLGGLGNAGVMNDSYMAKLRSQMNSAVWEVAYQGRLLATTE